MSENKRNGKNYLNREDKVLNSPWKYNEQPLEKSQIRWLDSQLWWNSWSETETPKQIKIHVDTINPNSTWDKVIANPIWKIPRLIQLQATHYSLMNQFVSMWAWDWTSASCVRSMDWYWDDDESFILRYEDWASSNRNEYSITVDETNITLSPNKFWTVWSKQIHILMIIHE